MKSFFRRSEFVVPSLLVAVIAILLIPSAASATSTTDSGCSILSDVAWLEWGWCTAQCTTTPYHAQCLEECRLYVDELFGEPGVCTSES
ncbi:MAG: hypothetical protein MI919_11340 [Holophagales bacterium]|nr:hypothetical protein [Holophagales bacterium]